MNTFNLFGTYQPGMPDIIDMAQVPASGYNVPVFFKLCLKSALATSIALQHLFQQQRATGMHLSLTRPACLPPKPRKLSESCGSLSAMTVVDECDAQGSTTCTSSYQADHHSRRQQVPAHPCTPNPESSSLLQMPAPFHVKHRCNYVCMTYITANVMLGD